MDDPNVFHSSLAFDFHLQHGKKIFFIAFIKLPLKYIVRANLLDQTTGA